MEFVTVKPKTKAKARAKAKARVVPTFRILPPAVKDRIFALLDKKSRCMARGVCIDWALWLKTYYGVHLVITNSNSYYLMTKRDYGDEVTQVTLFDWTYPIERQQTFRVSRYLTTLEVSGRMNPYNLKDFLSHCDLLENIIFTMCEFDALLDSDLTVDGSKFKPKAKLKSILIKADDRKWNFCQDDLFVIEIVRYYDLSRLASFILTRQNSVVGTKCDFNITGKRDFTVGLGGIICLDESTATLRNVTKMITESSPTLKILHLENIAEILYERGRPVTLPVVKELTGVARYSYGWGALLAEQNCLTVFRVEFLIGFWKEVKKCITTCAATLREVKFVGFYGVDPEISINLNFMRNLPRLKRLEVFCTEGIITVKKFPPSLESLCLDAAFSREDFRYFVLSFTNLRRFCLMNYGYDNSEGDEYSHIPADIFDLDQFRFLVRAPKLQKIVFDHCMMYRMKIVDFCKETLGMHVKSQCATMAKQTIGYMYNMEVSISSYVQKVK